MDRQVAYEQPLNERIRTFLRIEYLFDMARNYAEGDTDWDSRISVASLIDIVDLLGRSDIKTELIKELERHASTLSALESNPGVDRRRLLAIMGEINDLIGKLRDTGYQPGQDLRSDELVQSIRQRTTIAGGTCNFDLPAYHHWLNRPAGDRIQHLESWQTDLMVLRKSLKLALNMIRNSTTPTREQAVRGFFQKPIESNVSCQMVRVQLPGNSKYFPEISGGRHRFTVRFMEQAVTTERPSQTDDTVDFELHCCIL